MVKNERNENEEMIKTQDIDNVHCTSTQQTKHKCAQSPKCQIASRNVVSKCNYI